MQTRTRSHGTSVGKILSSQNGKASRRTQSTLGVYRGGVKAAPDFTNAACRDADPELFFSEGPNSSEREWQKARLICKECPVVFECAMWALEHEISYGMWGGTTPQERKELTKDRRKVG